MLLMKNKFYNEIHTVLLISTVFSLLDKLYAKRQLEMYLSISILTQFSMLFTCLRNLRNYLTEVIHFA